ncbi:hypothetical protein C2S52_015170 [Perilla frutescens var. hirtella]|nr:hypothetical protein C2S52_015170 [Perilla frutescens var. hirtella]
MARNVEKKDCEESNMGFTCEICTEASIPTQRFRHNHSCDNICLNDCDPNICHANCAPNICLKCLASHIQVKVDENTATIRCPSCSKTLNPVECQPLIPAEIFVKWCDCRCRSSVSLLESCYCPYRTCSELILNECDDTTKKCACPQCKKLLCFKCKVPWHAGFWCSESSQGWDSDDQELGFMMEQKNWTRCPGCGQPTDRVDGCPILQCR